jgi:hypothetical protein
MPAVTPSTLWVTKPANYNGNASQYVGKRGELIWNGATNSFRVSDQVTAGGIPLGLAGPAPASASSAGYPGQIAYDNTHIYVCIATNSWIRASASSW